MQDDFDTTNDFWNILDEILYRDPPRLGRHLELVDGATRVVETVSFADGSQLAISAQVQLPPLGDMTPARITFLKLNGERGEKWDDGTSEAMDLARQSAAVRFFEKISQLLDGMPEREKITCPTCLGERNCSRCHGKGCDECQGTGACPECHGHGKIAKEG
jgi:hypothetical protein